MVAFLRHTHNVDNAVFGCVWLLCTVKTKDGVAFVLRMLKEESLVSFGKSPGGGSCRCNG